MIHHRIINDDDVRGDFIRLNVLLTGGLTCSGCMYEVNETYSAYADERMEEERPLSRFTLCDSQ